MHSDPMLQTAWAEAKELDEKRETESVSKHEKISKASEPEATEGKPVLA